MKIALDAMGGDLAPASTVGGALSAVRDLGLEVILVGREAVIREELARQEASDEPGIHVHDAPDVVSMDDDPKVVYRGKKESSVNRGARLVHEGPRRVRPILRNRHDFPARRADDPVQSLQIGEGELARWAIGLKKGQ